MTDYLAKIAAWTVECPNLDCKGTGYITTYGGYDGTVPTEGLCPVCMNTGRVLDPRFEGLRQSCTSGSHLYPVFIDDCPGYTVNRNLGVLLDIMMPYGRIGFQGIGERVRVRWFTWGPADPHQYSWANAPTSIEAAAKAVYDWLEAEKKVTA